MKLKLVAVLALMVLPSLALADWRGGGGRYGGARGGYGGYHGGYGGYHGYHGYDRGWHHGGRSFFDFSLGFGGYSGGYYPAYDYAPPVVYSAPAPVVSYGNYDYYGGSYYGAPVVVEPAPIVTRSYVTPLPPIRYSRPYYGGYYGPRYDFSARYYYRH